MKFIKLHIITILFILISVSLTVGYGFYSKSLGYSSSVATSEPGLLIFSVASSDENNTEFLSGTKEKVSTSNGINLTSDVDFNIKNSSSSSITITYTIINQSSGSYTYNGYEFSNDATLTGLPVPYVEGITQGDVLAPYQTKTVTVTYYYNSNVTSTTLVSTVNKFKFLTGSQSVAISSINGSVTYTSYDPATKIGVFSVTMTNNYDSSVRYNLTSNNSNVSLVNSMGTSTTYSYSLGLGESKTVTIYLLYSTNVRETTDIILTTHDGDTYIISDDLSIIYKDSVLNGAIPSIASDLIPVTIGTDGVVTYANETEEWYNYTNKTWANAVKLISSPSTTYNVGTTINASDISAYFVWIPRYKYELWNAGVNDLDATPSVSVPFQINITFENKNTTPSTGSTNGTYLTHPAFTTFGSNGFWVGKFETTGSISSITVLPNSPSLTNVSVGNFFTNMYNYSRSDDSHMLKNTEWGAIAYLTYSAYGRSDEVSINNDSTITTGCGGATTTAASVTTCTNAYGSLSTNVYPQSTTGNISVVFDMSGGAYEYVSGYMSGDMGSSGLDISSYDAKYYDVYATGSTNTSFNNRILGDATGELRTITNHRTAWYNDYAYFVQATYSWFRRGGQFDEGENAGIMNFYRHSGSANSSRSARLALTIAS